MFKRFILFALSCALVVQALTGCTAAGNDVSYVPSAYGQDGACYYVDDPSEVVALQQAGLCQASWHPMVMPPFWHARYAGFYDSPAYINVYVPQAARTTYIERVKVFERDNSSLMTQESRNAAWKGTDGKKYSGSAVADRVKSSNASFGSGNVRSSGFSGGSVRSGSKAPNPGVKAPNPGDKAPKPGVKAPKSISKPARARR